jgi:hypothetical protein
MRTHSQIISDAGGPMALKRRLCLTATIHTIRSWAARNSIPAEYWNAVSGAKIASLKELADAAEARRTHPEPSAPANDDANPANDALPHSEAA